MPRRARRAAAPTCAAGPVVAGMPLLVQPQPQRCPVASVADVVVRSATATPPPSVVVVPSSSSSSLSRHIGRQPTVAAVVVVEPSTTPCRPLFEAGLALLLLLGMALLALLRRWQRGRLRGVVRRPAVEGGSVVAVTGAVDVAASGGTSTATDGSADGWQPEPVVMGAIATTTTSTVGLARRRGHGMSFRHHAVRGDAGGGLRARARVCRSAGPVMQTVQQMVDGALEAADEWSGEEEEDGGGADRKRSKRLRRHGRRAAGESDDDDEEEENEDDGADVEDDDTREPPAIYVCV